MTPWTELNGDDSSGCGSDIKPEEVTWDRKRH